jgi:hypothetical protein
MSEEAEEFDLLSRLEQQEALEDEENDEQIEQKRIWFQDATEFFSSRHHWWCR